MKRIWTALALLCFLSSVATAAPDTTPPTTSWKVVQKDGIHWLSTPDGRPFYSKGVNFIDSGKESDRSLEKRAFYWGNFFPSADSWRHSVGRQLDGWGFNTRGGWSDPSPLIDLPLMVDIELGRNSKLHWFDPFDPAMEAKALETAERLTAPFQGDKRLIGYFSDNEVGWWNSALFIWYLGKGWENHTKRVLWQILFDQYSGDWDKLLADWVPQGDLASFEDLKRADTKLKLRPGGRGIHVVDRFTYVCARHYYDLMYRTLRKAHPEALVLGDRLPLYYHQDAVRAIGDNIDVVSTNYNVDGQDGWVAPYYFEGLRRLTGKPVMITEFFFAAEENRTGNKNETARSQHPKPGHLMTVQTQAERAAGLTQAIRSFAAFPNVVGAHWFQYCDEPFGGREDGEDYNMGLIDTANRPYEAVIAAFRENNPELDRIHEQSLSSMAAGQPLIRRVSTSGEDAPVAIPRTAKPINVSDQTLMDWDKAATRIVDLQAPEPYVPFGDIHLAWSPEGIYLANISNMYFDPNFLDYKGEFPLAEAFQLHFFLEADGVRHHYGIYLVPEPAPALPDGFDVKPRLFRLVDGKPVEEMHVEGRVQRLNKSLPHMHLEAFFPGELFGLKRFEPGTRLRLDVAMTNYFHEFTTGWASRGLQEGSSRPFALKEVVLQDSFPTYQSKAPEAKRSATD
ncbi:MAG: hypothetical protein AB9873_13930 [Syntrophobacteraceae bacterium]